MSIELWNKNARDGKIAIAKEETARVLSGHRRDVNIQESKSEVIKTIAKVVGDVAKAVIGSKGN